MDSRRTSRTTPRARSRRRGLRPDGKDGAKDHTIKLRLEEFKPEGRMTERFEGEGAEMKRKGS